MRGEGWRVRGRGGQAHFREDAEFGKMDSIPRENEPDPWRRLAGVSEVISKFERNRLDTSRLGWVSGENHVIED